MSKFLPVALVASLLAVAALSAADAETAAEAPPNIVVIMVDDMGYGDPGCYNPGSKIATPHIDSLARDGMRFTDAHAPGPLCHMSRYGLLTGRYPFRTDVGRWPKHALIEPDQTTFADVLRARGYRTAMVGKWHLGFDEDGYDNPLPGGPVDCGFDTFFGIRASTDIPPYFYIRGDHAVAPPTEDIAAVATESWSPIQGAFSRAGKIAPGLRLADVLPRFTDEAVDVIREHAAAGAAKPLLLYLAYPAPHTPWLPSPEFAGKSKAALYGDFVEMVDAQVGRVLGALDEAELADDTLLVFTSDNGPVWYPADVERLGHDSAGGLRGMKSDAWEAGHRMPFLVRWPGEVAPGSTCDRTVCFTDLLATFAAVAGYERRPDEGPDSFDLTPALRGALPAGEPARPPLPIRSGGGLMTYRDGPWKLIDGLGSGGFTKPSRVKPPPGDPPGQLYHLGDDPAETTNLYAERPEVVARLRAGLRAEIARETRR